MNVWRIGLLALVLVFVAAPAAAQPIQSLPGAGAMSWGGWRFEWQIGDKNKEGLVLRNVRWDGQTILYKASVPVIRVKYRGDADDLGEGCGPYLDRIHDGNIERLRGQTGPVIARVFGDVLELAIYARIGDYDIYQAWYFHVWGRLEPVVYSAGWSCGEDPDELDHKHHVYWRLDFDMEGATDNEVFLIRKPPGASANVSKYTQEWNEWRLSDAETIGFVIGRPGSSRNVLIRAPGNERRDPAGSPWFKFSSKDAGIRRYRDSEDEGWEFDWDEHLGFINPAEQVENRDIVFWSVGHLSHPWSQADENNPEWHSTGLIIDVNWAGIAQVLQMIQMPLNQPAGAVFPGIAQVLQMIQMPLNQPAGAVFPGPNREPEP